MDAEPTRPTKQAHRARGATYSAVWYYDIENGNTNTFPKQGPGALESKKAARRSVFRERTRFEWTYGGVSRASWLMALNSGVPA